MSEMCLVHGRPYASSRGMANGIIALHCTWDGSLHPDVFMNYLKQPGTVLTPTDKDYKVYISVASDEAEQMRVVCSTSRKTRPGSDDGTEYGREWMTYEDAVKQHPELREDYERHLRHVESTAPSHPWRTETHWVQVGPRGDRREDKFYFEHLEREQRKEFIRMLNAGELPLKEPGYFYRLPFFVAR